MTAGRPKRHSASFRRVLVLVYGTVILFALLITGIYTVVSPQIFASNKISDLIPKGQIIAGYIESTLRGELSSTYLVPLIGRSKIPNLFLNTGHGTLGWTEGPGSGKALAEIVSGRKPDVDFHFL